jgi:hypothetical protein
MRAIYKREAKRASCHLRYGVKVCEYIGHSLAASIALARAVTKDAVISSHASRRVCLYDERLRKKT